MKNRFNNLPVIVCIIFFVMFYLSSCDKTEMTKGLETPISLAANGGAAKKLATGSTSSIVVPFFIEDPNSVNPVTGINTPLYTVAGHKPILAPDGHHVTLGEFNEVTGTAEVKCLASGTQVKLHLKNLIPKGVYTIWSLTFQSPGFDGTLASFGYLTGQGSLASNDGSSNTFEASASGEGQITRIAPSGDLSVFGTLGHCILLDEFEVHFVGVYHIDGMTYGPVPGPDGTFIEHFGFIFKN